MKHLGRVLGISSLLLLALTAVSFGQTWSYGGVTVYDSRDGRGNLTSFSVGEYRNDRGEFGTLRNDSAQSVTVPNGYQVRFCEDEGRNGNGSGRCEEFGEGLHNLRYGGRASYIRVTGPSDGGRNGGNDRGVTVFEDRDFQGRSQQFGVGRYLNNAGGLGNIRNDTASSVVVDRGYRVRLCEDEGSGGGSGACEEYSDGAHNLRYNDKASYIEVQRGNGGWNGGDDSPRYRDEVVVYTDANQRGTRQSFADGVYRWAEREFGRLDNDSASSIFVPNGYRVRLCENDGRGPRGERCEDYGSGSYNLRFNDTASSIEVRRGSGGRWDIGSNGGGWGNNDDGGWGGGPDSGVIVYSDRNQSGSRQSFDAGTYRADRLQMAQIGNDTASSIWVANGFRAQLCEDVPRGFFGNTGEGRCEEYGPGKYNLRYNDIASYIRVWRSR